MRAKVSYAVEEPQRALSQVRQVVNESPVHKSPYILEAFRFSGNDCWMPEEGADELRRWEAATRECRDESYGLEGFVARDNRAREERIRRVPPLRASPRALGVPVREDPQSLLVNGPVRSRSRLRRGRQNTCIEARRYRWPEAP